MNHFIDPKCKDQPLTSKDQELDLLGFQKSAWGLARSIKALEVEESKCIGVLGELGSGKTSFLNFLRDQFDDEKAIVLSLDAWLCAQEGRFLSSFITTLFTDLEKNPRELKKDRFKSFIRKSVGTGFRQNQFEEEKSLLRKHLLAQESYIICFVDNLDKLEHGDARRIICLLKEVLDLPKMIFVLAFDPNFVATAYNQFDPISGEYFLDGVIEIRHDLPHISDQQKEEQIKSLMDLNFRGDFPMEMVFESPAWQETNSYFLNFFRNYRDIKRFITNLTFVEKTTDKFKRLNPFDRFTIQMLRIMTPATYRLLQHNPAASHDERWNSTLGNSLPKHVRTTSLVKLLQMLEGQERQYVANESEGFFFRFSSEADQAQFFTW